LHGTRWATERRQHRGGTLPAIDLERHAAVCAFVAGLVSTIVSGVHDQPPLLTAVHDVSSGGLAVALGEMAVAAGTGCVVALGDPAELFTELPSRFVAATAMPDELCARAENLGIPAFVLGRAGGDRFAVGDLIDLPLEAVGEAQEGNLARLLGDS
jgi:phosphoribosylformylglycinamidine (FGAM) synthase-like enzyme